MGITAKIRIFYFIMLSLALPVLRNIKFTGDIPVTVYYGAFILCMPLVMLNRGKRINWTVLIMLAFCLMSILGNEIPSFTQPYERFIGMVLIITCVGPLFISPWLNRVRLKMFKWLRWIMVFISCISFVLYIVYRPITITERGNLFGGITVHSMLMGPLAAMSALYLIQYVFEYSNRLTRSKLLILSFAILSSLLSMVLAGSRIAILAFALSLLVWAVVYLKDVKRILIFFTTTIALILVTSPLWWGYTETIQRKMEMAEQRGSVVSSRASLWQSRINEIKDSPFIGIGYGCTSESKRLSLYTSSPSTDGKVEPGNGWLFVMSSTGIPSFLCLMGFIINLLVKLYRKNDAFALSLFSFIVYIFIHQNAEGSIFASGSFMFWFVWFTFGVAKAYITEDKK